MKQLGAAIGMSVLAFGFSAATAGAAPNYTLFGDATVVEPGHNSAHAAQLVSDDDPAYGGVEFNVPAGTTFGSLNSIATDYNVTEDNCGVGSPRFQVEVTTPDGPKNIFVYLGPAPNYNECTPDTWVASGDLLDDSLAIDTSQLSGGTFYDTYADALAEFGTYPVTGISVVVDAGYSSDDGEQTILIDNVQINDQTTTFEPESPVTPASKDQCKKDGWKTFGMFKNQGDCVSYVATNGRNHGSQQ